nr:uncharacterized protein LOC127309887 [Lolium perenne]
MDGELVVADATRDAARDDEHLAILISLLVTIAEEDNRSLVALRRAPKEQAKEALPKIVENLRELDYFKEKGNIVGELGLSTIQKCAVALLMLAYGIAGDTRDDYSRMAESTTIDCMYRLCRAIVAVFGKTYLRTSNAADTTRILAQNAEIDFPGMLGSIHCMHWAWKKYRFSHRGMYKGHKGACSVVLEAVADDDAWIWHAFFGMAGSHNVMRCSHVFQKLVEGIAPPV